VKKINDIIECPFAQIEIEVMKHKRSLHRDLVALLEKTKKEVAQQTTQPTKG
jgi:hypothetical protein